MKSSSPPPPSIQIDHGKNDSTLANTTTKSLAKDYDATTTPSVAQTSFIKNSIECQYMHRSSTMIKLTSAFCRHVAGPRMMSGINNANKLIHVERNVKEALANGEPVVALESTIIGKEHAAIPVLTKKEIELNVLCCCNLPCSFFSQLMECHILKICSWQRIWNLYSRKKYVPVGHDQKLDAATKSNMFVRVSFTFFYLHHQGVTPATIAVKNGLCRIGLSFDELEDLATSGAKKCSTRDLSTFLAASSNKGQWGATTVASTMKLAHLAGISTFVTGGTGGVHREGQDTMDISADLSELALTPVVVVSAGVKSILDIEVSDREGLFSRLFPLMQSILLV